MALSGFRHWPLVATIARAIAGALSGILDWAFSHYGSPAEDLAWVSVRAWRFNEHDKPIGEPRVPLVWEIAGNLRWALCSVYQGERYLSGEERDLELIARRKVEMAFEALRLIQRGGL